MSSTLVAFRAGRRTVSDMTKLLSITAIAALSAFLLSSPASAQDTAPVCSPGYTLVQSVGGPLCVGTVYLDGDWTDPATCLWGYYQGSCAPEPHPRVDLGVAAYTFQMNTPVVTVPATADQPVAAIVEPVMPVWLTAAELVSLDRRHGPR